MIAQTFEYSAAQTLDEALGLLSSGDAKVLAGGMSLIPMMKLRLAAPGRLVDLSRVPGLKGIREEGAELRIGAMTTHYEIESSAIVRGKCPLLEEAAAAIGDVQVRNMGTIGGSVAHADPAADYPASLLALEAKVKLARKGGERTLAISDFLVDTLTTAIEPGEIITEIIVPVEPAGTGVSYQKMLQPASGFAIVGVAARVRNGFVRIGVTGLAGKAFRASAAEKIFAQTKDPRKSAAAIADGVDANSDVHASAGYRKHMAAVYGARALNAAMARTT
jgi:carbon-monoxide dehydrogenase medium subunit